MSHHYLEGTSYLPDSGIRPVVIQKRSGWKLCEIKNGKNIAVVYLHVKHKKGDKILWKNRIWKIIKRRNSDIPFLDW